MEKNKRQGKGDRGNSMEWNVGPARSPQVGATPGQGQNPEIPDYLSFLDNETETTENAFNFDPRRYIAGIWQHRVLGVVTVAITFSLILLAVTLGVSHNWQSTSTLIKRSHQDRLTLAERDPFKTQDYSLATLLDTLKLPARWIT